MLSAHRAGVADPPPGSSATGRVTVVVMYAGSTPVLCPFFSKCDGVLLVNHADRSVEFYPGRRANADSMCDLILKLRPSRIICGFIDGPETARLRAAGIDVRLGACSVSIEDLVSSFATLPKA